MADSHSKILRITGIVFAGTAMFYTLHAADQIIGNDVSGEGLKMPVYGEDKLDFIITSKEVVKTGEIINASTPVVEFIHPEANIDDITFMEELIPYELRAPEAEVVDFWNSRLFSNALLSSHDSVIDQTSSMATSEDIVYFRSPLADLNGTGYIADYKNRTVLIRDNVEMVSRPSLQSPEDIIAAGQLERQSPDEALLDTLKVWSETLFIDMNNNQITLTGDVQLQENRLDDLRCAKMIINFDSQEKSAGEATVQTADEALSDAGKEFNDSRKLSNIVCEGNVFIKEPRGNLFCDNMTIFFAENALGKTEISKIICRNNIKLTGKNIKDNDSAEIEVVSKSPMSAFSGNINSGTLYADYGELDFPSNVGVFKEDVIVVADDGSTLACDELYLHTADIPEGDVIPEDAGDGKLPTRIAVTDTKELISITASGNVQMESDSPQDGKQVITGSIATYTVGTHDIEMRDDVNGMATLIRYKDKRKYMSRQIFIDAQTGDARGIDFRSVPLR